MARIRTIKPDLFRHESLFEAERESGLPLRLAFAGLFTAADRDGRFRWQPRALKLDCLPYDDVDFSRVLDALATRGFIVMYRVNDHDFGFIPSWHKHQIINNREKASDLPAPNENNSLTREVRVDDASSTPLCNYTGEGKGKEGKGKEEDAAPNGAHSNSDSPPPVTTEESDLYRRGKEILGDGGGGLISKLRKAKGGSVQLARAAIETAATKQDPREYIGAIIRGRDGKDDLRARGEAW